ncbi:MAG: response regulator transcription factor [Actinomycetota bacterium]
MVVADDHPVVIAGMRLLFADHCFFRLVGEACTGAEAIARCDQLRPDVLLLDLRLPDLAAATICSRVKERHPHTSIVILTAYFEEPAVRGCITAGARGCLLKDVSERNLLGALLQVIWGRTVLDPRAAGALVPRRPAPVAPDGALSDRQHEVLRMIARGLTTAEIAGEFGLSPNTIKDHMRSLFAKLAARNRIQALAVARERGLL